MVFEAHQKCLRARQASKFGDDDPKERLNQDSQQKTWERRRAAARQLSSTILVPLGLPGRFKLGYFMNFLSLTERVRRNTASSSIKRESATMTDFCAILPPEIICGVFGNSNGQLCDGSQG